MMVKSHKPGKAQRTKFWLINVMLCYGNHVIVESYLLKNAYVSEKSSDNAETYMRIRDGQGLA